MASSCIDAYSKDLSSTSTPSLLPSISILAHSDEQISHRREYRSSIPPSSTLPPEPRSFSSNCSNRRLGAPPLPPALLSTASKHIHLSPTGLNTPLTALSIGEEQSPGILTPLRRFPLPPAGGSYRHDNDRTPTLPTFEEEEEEQNQRQTTNQHRRTAIMRLPGALASLDSLDSSLYNTQAPDFRNSVAHSTAAASIYDDSLEEDNRPATPRSNRTGERRQRSPSSSCYASPELHLQTSPYSSPAPPSRTRRSGKAYDRQSSSSHSQTSADRTGMKHKQSRTSLKSKQEESMQEDTYIAREQQQRQPIRAAATRQTSYYSNNDSGGTARPTSRAASWRSRYSRPDTAMSTATTAAETVYEDALDGFEADEEAEEASVCVRPSISDRRPSLNLTLSTSSSLSSETSTVRKSRFRLSFQRRRAESPLNTNANPHRLSYNQRRPESQLSGSESYLHRQDSNSTRTASAWKRSSTVPVRYTPDRQLSSSPAMSISASASSVDDKRLSGTASGILSSNRILSQSSDATIDAEIIKDKERAASPSSTSSLRPLMLTLETTRRGSLKDWMVQSGSKSLPSLPDDEELATRSFVQEANENPYAQIYEELAKSPELERDSELPSPSSAHVAADQPSLGPPINAAALSSSSYLKQVQQLPPLVEESYIDAEESMNMNNNSSLLWELSALNLLPGTSAASQGDTSAEMSDRSAAGIALSTDSPPVRLRQRSIDRGSSSRHGHGGTGSGSKDWIGIPSPSDFSKAARNRTISSNSTSFAKPTTIVTSISNSITTTNTGTGTSLNSAEYATVETGLRGTATTSSFSTPVTRHTPRSPISSRFLQAGFEQDLKDFFKLDDMQGGGITASASMKTARAGSLPPPAAGPFGKSSFDDVTARMNANDTNDAKTATRKRTKSQPVSSQALKRAYHDQNNIKAFIPLPFPSQGTTSKDGLYAVPTVKESIPFPKSSTWSLTRKIKISNARKISKGPQSPSSNQSSSVIPSVNGLPGLFSTVKKRKSTPDVKLGIPKPSGAQNSTMRSLRSIRDMIISAPIQAEHICTGALDPHPNRESPFGRRPSSPVQGYIDVPGRTSSVISGSLFLEDLDAPTGVGVFDATDPSASASDRRTSSGSRSRSRSSPSQDRTSAASTSTYYNSPITFSSPISSTSSHSWDGPDTPSITTANSYIAGTTGATARPASSNGGQDFWAVDFAVAQSGDNDFIAPHASLVKTSSKLALLSTNEKARRRASKASMQS